MTDTTTNTKPDRKKVADHFLLDGSGQVVKEMEKACGIRYVAVGKADAPFDFIFDGATPGTALTMLAIFGAKTKATNEASRVRNGEGGGVDEQLSAIDDVFSALVGDPNANPPVPGVWREKSEGGGTKLDWDTVAQCLATLLGDTNKEPVHVLAQRFIDGYETAKHGKLTGDQYKKLVWSNDAIKTAYRKAKGQTGAALDDLA